MERVGGCNKNNDMENGVKDLDGNRKSRKAIYKDHVVQGYSSSQFRIFTTSVDVIKFLRVFCVLC